MEVKYKLFSPFISLFIYRYKEDPFNWKNEALFKSVIFLFTTKNIEDL